MENLKKLFESSVLSEETQVAVQEAFDQAVEARSVELQAEYDEKLAESMRELTQLIPDMIEESVANELADIADEVKEARSLEVTYAERLETFKENYDQRMKEQIEVLVAESVAEEFEELKEDIDLAKKHQFAIQITESFRDVYQQMFGAEDFDTAAELKEAKAQLESYQRKEKMDELLEGLAGSKRKVAETILESVAIDKMEAKFESVRGLLIESAKPKEGEEQINEGDEGKELEGTVVIESDDAKADDENDDENDVGAKQQKTLKEQEDIRRKKILERSIRLATRQ